MTKAQRTVSLFGGKFAPLLRSSNYAGIKSQPGLELGLSNSNSINIHIVAIGGAGGVVGGAVAVVVPVAARRCLICINDNESHKTCVVVVRLDCRCRR